jgi:hypothetical protein
MLATRIIGWISFFFIVGFLIYGFRQGFRAKAEAKKNLAPSASNPGGDSGSDSARSP